MASKFLKKPLGLWSPSIIVLSWDKRIDLLQRQVKFGSILVIVVKDLSILRPTGLPLGYFFDLLLVLGRTVKTMDYYAVTQNQNQGAIGSAPAQRMKTIKWTNDKAKEMLTAKQKTRQLAPISFLLVYKVYWPT